MEKLENLNDDVIIASQEDARKALTLRSINQMQEFREFYKDLIGRDMTYMDMYAIQMFLFLFGESDE